MMCRFYSCLTLRGTFTDFEIPTAKSKRKEKVERRDENQFPQVQRAWPVLPLLIFLMSQEVSIPLLSLGFTRFLKTNRATADFSVFKRN